MPPASSLPAPSQDNDSKIAWVNAVLAQKDKGNDAAFTSALAPRLALLKDSKVTQDPNKASDTINGMNDIASRCPRVFAVKGVVDELLKLLAWSSGLSAPRDGIAQHQLACALLHAGHKDLDFWPTSLVKAFLDDALQGRRWVDIQHASALVANITTAFPSAPDMAPSTASDSRDQKGGMAGKEPDPKRRKVIGGAGSAAAAAANDASAAKGAGSSFYADEDGGEDSEKAAIVRPRFRKAALQTEIADMVLEAVKKNLDPQPIGDSTQRKLQNLLKILVLLVVYEPVRNEVVKRLEQWINNPNLVRHVKELMPRLASQCTLSTEMEQDTVRHMLRMRPKANATQMHNEAFALLCRSNRKFPLRAFFTLLEMELEHYDQFVNKINKSLKNSNYISTILKFSGVPHFTADRLLELGGSLERFNVTDLGLGKLEYYAQAPLKLWASVMPKGKSRGSASGVIIVASEEEACVGSAEDPQADRVQAAALRALEAGAAGLVVIMQSGSQKAAAPRTWDQGNITIPVIAILPGQDLTTLHEAIKAGMNGSLSREPRETNLANCINSLADSGDRRAGLSLLLRKVFKTCQMTGVPELDLVALSSAIMVDVEPESPKEVWATALVDVISFICIHLASQVVEAGQASVHAERGVGGQETRSARAGVRVRGQVMRIIEAMLQSWVKTVLVRFLPRKQLHKAVRKMLFYEDAAVYSAEPLILETQERQGVKLLQTEMGVTQNSLVSLAELGLHTANAAGVMEASIVLELIDLMVRRAVPVASRHAHDTLAKPPSARSPAAATISGQKNLEISGEGVCVWEKLLELARTCGEEGGHPELAPAARVWQAYIIIAILAVFNTSTLGKLVWARVPTLASVLQLLITGSFNTPPTIIHTSTVSADEKPFVVDPLVMEAEAKRQDAAVIQQVTAMLTQNRRAEPQWLPHATLIRPLGPARWPPRETVMLLKDLDDRNHLGHLLRLSKDPNMLLETIMAHGVDSSSCVGWLGAVLHKYPMTVNALPVVTVCQLLLANLGAALGVLPSKCAAEGLDSKSSNILRIAMQLAECIHEIPAGAGGETPTKAVLKDSKEWGGLLFFLDLLGDTNEHKRRMAVIALGLVLSCLGHMRRESKHDAVAVSTETLMMSSSMEQDAESGEEEELLAGGGVEEELLAGGGEGAEVEVLAGGGGGGGVGGGSVALDGGESSEESSAKYTELVSQGRLEEATELLEMALFASVNMFGTDSEQAEKAARELVQHYNTEEGVVRVKWLLRLVEMVQAGFLPACIHETLALRLRSALKTETEGVLLLHYLEYLGKVAPVSASDLAQDVAELVLRRRVLVQHLSKLPGATWVLTRILFAALTNSDTSTSIKDENEEIFQVPGSSCRAPLIVLRAGLQTLCLSVVPENNSSAETQQAAAGEREKVMRLLVPTKSSMAVLGLTDEEMASLLQSQSEHMTACAVASATPQQLVGALSLSGATAACLAAVVARIKSLGKEVPPFSAKLQRGMGARAVAMLKTKHAKESEWLSDKLGIKLTAPKKLLIPNFSRVLLPSSAPLKTLATHTPSSQIKVDASSARPRSTDASATTTSLRRKALGCHLNEAASGALVFEVPNTVIAELVKSEGVRGDEDARMETEDGGGGQNRRPWESVVRGLVTREVPLSEQGLRLDFLSAVNPLPWSRGRAAQRVLERVFGTPQAAVVGGGDRSVGGGRGRSCHAALAGPLIALGGSAGGEALGVCRQWLLLNAALDTCSGAMHAVPVEEGGGGEGSSGTTVLDCGLCLEVLSTCITGESGPIEGTWGEGGGGEVSETKTRRENMGLVTRAGADAGDKTKAGECVVLAQYIVSEGCSLGGRVAMGRIQLLLLLLNEDQEATQAVSNALLSLVSMQTADAGVESAGASGGGIDGWGGGSRKAIGVGSGRSA